MTLRDLIPAPARRVVYAVLGAAYAIEAIWDVIPEGTEGRILLTLGVLGFGLAAGNVNKPEG